MVCWGGGMNLPAEPLLEHPVISGPSCEAMSRSGVLTRPAVRQARALLLAAEGVANKEIAPLLPRDTERGM